MGDYNEMLITNAGDDKPKQVRLIVLIEPGQPGEEILRFTNLDMDVVKAAIDVLNGDPAELWPSNSSPIKPLLP